MKKLTLRQQLENALAEISELRLENERLAKRANYNYECQLSANRKLETKILEVQKYVDIADFILGYPERERKRLT